MGVLIEERPQIVPVRVTPQSGGPWRVGVTATAVAAIANVVISLATAAAGVDHLVGLAPGSPPITVTTTAVVLTTVATMVAGLGVTHLARRRWRDATRVLRIVGGALALASLALPLAAVDATTDTGLALAAMHLVVGLAFVAALGRLQHS